MDKKSQFLYQFRAFFFNSNSIPIPFFSIPIPSPIPGIESGIELNSHSIPELTPTLHSVQHFKYVKKIKYEVNQQYLKTVDLDFVNSE